MISAAWTTPFLLPAGMVRCSRRGNSEFRQGRRHSSIWMRGSAEFGARFNEGHVLPRRQRSGSGSRGLGLPAESCLDSRQAEMTPNHLFLRTAAPTTEPWRSTDNRSTLWGNVRICRHRAILAPVRPGTRRLHRRARPPAGPPHRRDPREVHPPTPQEEITRLACPSRRKAEAL